MRTNLPASGLFSLGEIAAVTRETTKLPVWPGPLLASESSGKASNRNAESLSPVTGSCSVYTSVLPDLLTSTELSSRMVVATLLLVVTLAGLGDFQASSLGNSPSHF